MPLTDAEERLKLAWEIALMDMQIDRGRIDLEKIRQEIDNERVKNAKFLQDMEKTRVDMILDQQRLRLQFWGVFATMIAAFAGAFAAGATWWNYVLHH